MIEPAIADRERSAHEVVLRLHGVSCRVTTDDAALIEAIRATWGDLASPDEPAGPDGAFAQSWIDVQRTGDRIVVRGPDRPPTVVDAEHAILATYDRIVATVNAGLDAAGILVVHAGAVEIAGRAVCLAGPSGRGKSTLVVELLRRGAGLLSDESTLVAADDATVLAYPRAVHLGESTVGLIAQLDAVRDLPRRPLGGASDVAIAPSLVEARLGWRRSTHAPLGGLLLLGERLGPAEAPRIEPLSKAIAVLEVLRGTPSASWALDRTRERLADVLSNVPVARLRAGELAATGALVWDWMTEARAA